MKRKFAFAFTMLLLSCNVANASSLHGDFEGSPIVKLTSNGHEMKIDDVPAINYNGRTMVPIYLLNQIGAETKWNESTYSVNVKLPEPKGSTETKTKDTLSLRDAYDWLSDTNQALFSFMIVLQQYTDLENPSDYLKIIDLDFQDLNTLSTDSRTFALQVYNSDHSDNHINDILTSQAKTILQINQTIDLFKAWINSNKDPKVFSLLNINIHQSLVASQQNIAYTNKYKHDLIIKISE
jgi:hypothetical protein